MQNSANKYTYIQSRNWLISQLEKMFVVYFDKNIEGF